MKVILNVFLVLGVFLTAQPVLADSFSCMTKVRRVYKLAESTVLEGRALEAYERCLKKPMPKYRKLRYEAPKEKKSAKAYIQSSPRNIDPFKVAMVDWACEQGGANLTTTVLSGLAAAGGVAGGVGVLIDNSDNYGIAIGLFGSALVNMIIAVQYGQAASKSADVCEVPGSFLSK
ncbi:MAG: hypothetical protein HOI23_23005 [Deltaproteobacteria bacterium]|jgi:hypothetical protein|nr:hypothetical protein [Deltaproteobacteria bacterium]MBT6435734.1 hypothetical protein [Deltaproteobacteria bacterium]